MDEKHLEHVSLPQHLSDAALSDAIKSQGTGVLLNAGYNSAPRSPSTHCRQQEIEQPRKEVRVSVESSDVRLPKGRRVNQHIEEPFSKSAPRPTLCVDSFRDSPDQNQSSTPQVAVRLRRQSGEGALGRPLLPFQPPVLDQSASIPRTSFQCNMPPVSAYKSADRAVYPNRGRYDGQKPVLKAPSLGPTGASLTRAESVVALPTMATSAQSEYAPPGDSMRAHVESTGLASPITQCASMTSPVGVSSPPEGPSGGASGADPLHWSPPMSNSDTTSFTRGRRSCSYDGTAAAYRRAARLALRSATGSLGAGSGKAGGTSAVGSSLAPLRTSVLKGAETKSCSSTGSAMVTRRQAGSAALAEVVRIDDSSDEEQVAAPPTERLHGDIVGKARAQAVRPQNVFDGGGCKASRGPVEQQGGRAEKHSQPPTAYVVFVAAVVQGDGRCCLLSSNSFFNSSTRSSNGCGQHLELQQVSVGDAARAAAVLPAGERGNAKVKAGCCLLVLQADQDKHVMSLDLWSPFASSTQMGNETGCREGPVDNLASEDSLETLLSFPNHSIRNLRWLRLRSEACHSSRSGRSGSKAVVCRRCGRRKSRADKVNTASESRGKERRKLDTLFASGRTKSATVEPSAGHSSTCESEQADVNRALNPSVHSCSVAAGCNQPSVSSDVAHETGKDENQDLRGRRSHSCTRSSRRAASKEASEPQLTSSRHRLHGKNRTDKKQRSPRSGSRASSIKNRCVASAEKRSRTSNHTERTAVAGSPMFSAEVAPASHDPANEAQKRPHGALAPRNALEVTNGKPLFGGSLQLLPSQTRNVVLDSAKVPHCTVASTGNLTGGQDVSDERGSTVYSWNSSLPKIASDVGSQQAEDLQHHNTEVPAIVGTDFGGSSDQSRKGCASHKAGNCSMPNDRKAYSRVSSEAAATAPVLFIELKESQVGELPCSTLLQGLLRSSQVVRCDASTLPKEMNANADSEASIPKCSNGTQNKGSSTRCRGASGDSGSSSSALKRSSVHVRRSRDRPKKTSAHRSRSRSSSSHSLHRKHSTSKRRHTSTSRRSSRTENGSSSSKVKRRREAFSLTAATARDVLRKAQADSVGMNSLPQRGLEIVGGSGFGKVGSTSVSYNIPPDVDRLTEKGGNLLSTHGKDNNTVLALDMPLPAGEQKDDNGSPKASGESEKRCLWLMFCIGPPLHAALEGRSKEADSGGFTPSESLTAVIGPARHRQGLSSTVAPSISSTGCEQQSQGRDDKRPRCPEPFVMPLLEALPPALAATVAPCGSFGVPERPEHCIHVRTLVEKRTCGMLKQGSRTSGLSEVSKQQLIEPRHCLTRVLDELVWRAHNSLKRMNSGNGTICNIQLENLRSTWRARGFCDRKAVLDMAVSDTLAHVPASGAPNAKGSPTNKENPVMGASRTTVTSPLFDSLLDDKTLRRLSEKEFLDDTIIDFCLEFIVDHILPPEDRIRVHISNTFFLSTLMGETCEVEGHSRLTRWLKKELTPLPQKDFIFIPVHHKHQHWSLAVIVNPWRAINRTLEKTTDSLRPDAEVAVSKQDTDDQQHGVLPSIPVVVRPDSSHVDGYVRRASTAGYLHRSVTKRRLGQNAGTSDVSQTSGAPHAHRGLQPKARMFHVDSMGLRSVFDRCRGRLKRFLRREFEHRCEGRLKNGDRAEFCTESCCWQDGVSCSLHTPRQQNGYDCGVFVVEYVHFLAQNLNSIETILSGPTRDSQPNEHFSTYPYLIGRAKSPYTAARGSSGCTGVKTEPTCEGQQLERVLGFKCPCMAVESPVKSFEGPEIMSAWHFDVKARLAYLRRVKAAASLPAARELDAQKQPTLLPCVSVSGPHGEDVASTASQLGETVLISNATPVGVFPTKEEQCVTEPCRHATLLSTKLQFCSVDTSIAGVPRATAEPRKKEIEPLPQSSCPSWGPLPHSFSKRRSAHTKWFSQDRVTKRRSQLHKMLLFMRQNTNWRDDPKLVSHLKSLFLDVKGS